jgi:hypothetical protein
VEVVLVLHVVVVVAVEEVYVDDGVFFFVLEA